MDKIQIYFVFWLVLDIIIKVGSGIFKPDEPYSKCTNSQAAVLWPIGFIFTLPWAGRVLGWW
jgi:hypothetical protein